jgi:hypothetical protein
VKEEIESLNLNEIDIDELERRVELGQMIPIVNGPDQDDSCKEFICESFHAK